MSGSRGSVSFPPGLALRNRYAARSPHGSQALLEVQNIARGKVHLEALLLFPAVLQGGCLPTGLPS